MLSKSFGSLMLHQQEITQLPHCRTDQETWEKGVAGANKQLMTCRAMARNQILLPLLKKNFSTTTN